MHNLTGAMPGLSKVTCQQCVSSSVGPVSCDKNLDPRRPWKWISLQLWKIVSRWDTSINCFPLFPSDNPGLSYGWSDCEISIARYVQRDSHMCTWHHREKPIQSLPSILLPQGFSSTKWKMLCESYGHCKHLRCNVTTPLAVAILSKVCLFIEENGFCCCSSAHT